MALDAHYLHGFSGGQKSVLRGQEVESRGVGFVGRLILGNTYENRKCPILFEESLCAYA